MRLNTTKIGAAEIDGKCYSTVEHSRLDHFALVLEYQWCGKEENSTGYLQELGFGNAIAFLEFTEQGPAVRCFCQTIAVA